MNVEIDGDPLAEDGLRYETNGDTALALANLSSLGNAFSTAIAARTLQLFIIPALPILADDYNDDGVVDAADYAVWRNALDGGGTLEIETESEGVVDELDYHAWRTNYGNTLAPGAGGLTYRVPEPAGFALSLWGGVCYLLARRPRTTPALCRTPASRLPRGQS